MADIHILRPHDLGLPEARRIAGLWAQKAQAKFDMECTYAEAGAGSAASGVAASDPAADTLHFRRPGIEGTLQVTGQRFELQAELGFLFAAFKDRITDEIQAQFDKLLAPSTA